MSRKKPDSVESEEHEVAPVEASQPVTSQPEKRALEEWARELRTPDIDTLLARRIRMWPIGRFVTKAEFIGAVDAAKNAPIR